MKFLSFAFLAIFLLCLYFWLTDAPGSGMVYPVVGLPVLYVLILGFIKLRTGKWFTDRSGGK